MLEDIVKLDDHLSWFSNSRKKRGRGTEKMKVIVALFKDGAGCPRYLEMSDVQILKGITVDRFAKKNIRERTQKSNVITHAAANNRWRRNIFKFLRSMTQRAVSSTGRIRPFQILRH